MSIRKKFLITILCITFCLIIIFYTVISLVVYDNFDQLEKEMVIESLERVQVTLRSQAQALDTLTHVWASRDDTYAFVNDYNNKYIRSNIINDTLTSNANIDLLLILDTNDSPVFGVSFDKKHHKAKGIDPALLQAIVSHNNALGKTPHYGGRSGIIHFGNNRLVIALRPILDSYGEGPVRGTLVMGRFLDTERIAQLRKLTLVSVDLYPIHKITPDAVDALYALLASDSPYYVTAYSEDTVKGYTLINDLSGNAVLLLAITVKRSSYQQSQKTIFFLLYAIVFISLVFGLIFFFFIDIVISRRLSSIIIAINQIEKSSDHGLRVKKSRLNDELGKLTISINHMLDANESLEVYKTKNEKLEALATFAAGATHELATPLGTIAIASGEILHDISCNTIHIEDLRDDMFLIRNQVNRCKELLFQLAAGAGEHMGEEIVSFSVSELINDALAIFDQETIRQIAVDIQIKDKLITMPVLSLRRVLRGMLKNSIDASKPGKAISLLCYENSTQLIFEIRDQGEGMDEHTLKHAIDPFFTTKPLGKGTGLGLYLAQSLANRYGGDLQISSTPSQGTTVSLSFAKEKIYVELR